MTTPILPERAAPAFSFYPNDFTVGTRTMSLAECGAYIRLLCHQWDTGSVPDNAVERARILGCSNREQDKVWLRLSDKFERGDDGVWRNARLEAERRKQQDRRHALATSGRKGADAKWHGKANSLAMAKPLANTRQGDGLSFSSSSSSSKTLSEKRESLSAPTHAKTDLERSGDFCEWYTETHERIIGVAYMGHPRNDFEASMRMVQRFTDQQMRDAALVFFGMDDDFATSGTRTVPKFASRITRCLELMRQKGIA